MNASSSSDGFNEAQLDEFASRVQDRLSRCQNCQPYDEGQPIWRNPHTDLNELMEEVGVPGACREEVAERVHCPSCGQSFELCEEVGYKDDAEVRYEKLLGTWYQKYQGQFEEFHKYLEDFPYLGLNHKFGRRIYKEVSGFPTTKISDAIWYRARQIVDGRELAQQDFYPPDPIKRPIGEGRFNHHGQRLFYLAGDEYGAATEVVREDETRAWVQKFRIKHIERILDLTHEAGWAEEGLPVTAGLMYVGALTRPVERENGWKPEYLVPRFIADCARAQGFEGIAFKSARHYFDNLVLFKFEPENIAPEGEPTIVKVGPVHRRTTIDFGEIPIDTEGANEEPSLGGSGDLQDF